MSKVSHFLASWKKQNGSITYSKQFNDFYFAVDFCCVREKLGFNVSLSSVSHGLRADVVVLLYSTEKGVIKNG